MPIKPIVLQRRLTEVGRIRIGEVKIGKAGKTYPSKLERFRVTSSDKQVLEQIAQLYGGTVEQWTPQGGGAQQWEVLTDANSIPVVVPPNSVTQWMETWSGGGIAHRCDGDWNVLTDEACNPDDPTHKNAKPTTRLSVMLRDVESIGVFRLESHGWNAAAELPGMAELLAQAGGYIDGRLYLKSVRQVSDGQTKDFMVPALAVDGLTPKQLLSGAAALTAVEAPKAQHAIEATKAASSDVEWRQMIASAGSVDEVRDIWNRAKEHDGPAWVEAECKTRATQITAAGRPDVAAATDLPDDEDALWAAIVAASPFPTLQGLEDDFAAKSGGVMAGSASAGELQTYLRTLVKVSA